MRTWLTQRHGVHSVGADRVSVNVTEGDSVTLHTDVKTIQQETIKWYFNDTRIAQISGDLSFICTDVQCNEGTERFRDRLNLNHQTGSLTIRDITNTRTTDSGEYTLHIIYTGGDSEKFFYVTVHGESFHECLNQVICVNHIIVFIVAVAFFSLYLHH
uniref:Immunoglobulin V-set domain-containing protein n=1 Tax=Cyprinus carpio TaxID=7962 RepID=A0A8C1SJ24_CYPCA